MNFFFHRTDVTATLIFRPDSLSLESLEIPEVSEPWIALEKSVGRLRATVKDISVSCRKMKRSFEQRTGRLR